MDSPADSHQETQTICLPQKAGRGTDIDDRYKSMPGCFFPFLSQMDRPHRDALPDYYFAIELFCPSSWPHTVCPQQCFESSYTLYLSYHFGRSPAKWPSRRIWVTSYTRGAAAGRWWWWPPPTGRPARGGTRPLPACRHPSRAPGGVDDPRPRTRPVQGDVCTAAAVRGQGGAASVSGGMDVSPVGLGDPCRFDDPSRIESTEGGGLLLVAASWPRRVARMPCMRWFSSTCTALVARRRPPAGAHPGLGVVSRTTAAARPAY